MDAQLGARLAGEGVHGLVNELHGDARLTRLQLGRDLLMRLAQLSGIPADGRVGNLLKCLFNYIDTRLHVSIPLVSLSFVIILTPNILGFV